MSDAININTATPDELATLPGVGSALAGRIVAYRERFGPFEQLEDLLRITGISERMLDAIRDLAVVGRGEDASDRDRGGERRTYDDGDYGDGNPPVTPGKHHGGDPVRIHEEYVQHHLQGETPATTEAYERAHEQFRRLPGAVQRPPTEVVTQERTEDRADESDEESR
jgi:competence ComEA-like helix-hairpin-helix protein